MTFPSILGATESTWSALAALVAGVVLAFFGAGLLPVSVVCCAVVFICELFLIR